MAEDSSLVANAASKADQEKKVEGVLKDAAKYWPIFMIRGLVLFIIGFVLIVFPEETVNAISIIFGILLLFEAASSGVHMCVITNHTADNPLRGAIILLYFFTMLVNLTLGILAMAFPDETARILLIIVAVWFVAIGFLEMVFVCCLRQTGDLKKSNGTTCCMMLGGALYLTFGIVLLTDLDQGVVAFVTFIGIVIMLFALQVICLGCMLRSTSKVLAMESETDTLDLTTNTESEIV